MPVAANCAVVPLAMLGVVVVTEIDCSVAAETLSFIEPLMPPNVALIVVVPGLVMCNACTTPVLLTVATAVFDDSHVTVSVSGCVVPSEKTPVAVNDSLLLAAIVEYGAVTSIDSSVAGVTVSDVDAVAPDRVAVIVVGPTAVVPAVASPVVLTPATVGADDVQVTCVVTSCLELSL